MADNYVGITFDGSTTEDGQTDATWTTGSTYTFVSQRIVTWMPLKITAVKLYIGADQTYNCYIDQVGKLGAGGAVTNTAITVETGVSVSGAPKWVTFTPSAPIFLMPGEYWVSFTSGGAVAWEYVDPENWIETALFFAENYYLGTTLGTLATLPVSFVAYKSTVSLT